MQDDCTPPWADRLLAKIDATGDCWEWIPPRTESGYARLWVSGRREYAHRLIWEWLVGPIPAGYEIDHLCRVRHCLNPDHLEAVLPRTNVHRSYSPFSPKVRRAQQRLASRDVGIIRRRYATGTVTMDALAAEYGVSRPTIQCVIRRVNCGHVA